LKRIIVGLTILAALLLMPLAGAIWPLIAGEPSSLPGYFTPAFKLVFSLVFGAIGVAVFARRSGLRTRVAGKSPGANTLLAGSLLFIGIPLVSAILLNERIEVQPFTFLLGQGMVHYPALVMLTAGAVRMLLKLRPSEA
jgi:hypothetical protein